MGKSPSRDWHWGHGRNRKRRWGFEDVLGAQRCYSRSCRAGGGGSRCARRRAPAHGTGGRRVQLRLENPIFGETKSCISGCQWLMDCSCPAKRWTQQGLRSLSTHKKKVFLITPELSTSFDTRLLFATPAGCCWPRGRCCPADMRGRLSSLELICCLVVSAKILQPFSRQLMLVPPPQWYPCFQNKKKNESKMASLSTEGRKPVFISLPTSNNCQLRSCRHVR